MAAAALPVNFVAGTVYWVAAEKIGEVKYGEVVTGVPGVAVKGGKAVHTLADGSQIFVECIDGADRGEFMRRPTKDDSRVFFQDLDALGKPDCSLKEVAAKTHETEVSWVLTWPRTSHWCISY